MPVFSGSLLWRVFQVSKLQGSCCRHSDLDLSYQKNGLHSPLIPLLYVHIARITITLQHMYASCARVN